MSKMMFLLLNKFHLKNLKKIIVGHLWSQKPDA